MVDVTLLLRRLATRRPLFHSEADFQHAFAWELQLEHPSAEVRLETRAGRGVRLDVLVMLTGERLAFELKYLVRRLAATVGDERYDLPTQGAHDISRHDVVKDIFRLEQFVATGAATRGWQITLSNDPGYWRKGTKESPIDAMFRLHDGRELAGTLSWDPRAGLGTTRKRDIPLEIVGTYACGWQRYSRIKGDDGRESEFRTLLFEVGPAR